MASVLSLPKIGLAFLGVVGASGVGLLIQSKLSSTPEKLKFRDRYKNALLDLKSISGDSFSKTEKKWEFIKNDQGTPKNALLKEAKNLFASDENNSKKKYREGCQSIYDSEFSDSGDLWDDFKTYCSKTNGDAFGTEKWINEAINTGSTVGSVWGGKLGSLKSKKDPLPSDLKKIQDTLTSEAYSIQQATDLKNWCDKEKVNPFEGVKSKTYEYLNDLCRIT